MKKAQLYRVGPLSEDNKANARPAQFVYTGHDYDETIIGFINAVDLENDELEICVFEPRKTPASITRVVKETVSKDEVGVLLRAALEKNPEMRSEWLSVVFDQTVDEETTTVH